ncbi:MAG TPA: ABC transporter ATP-binding protein [Geminicoccaceae bacterium]|nr:ABC transporter ATP-binding protein [Geminicoccus sp.]HMU52626.1 ABC transporter ATP-binding protein [Geminicoccaceae bacterium]
MSATPLLELRGLTTVFETRAGTVRAVDGVDLEVMPGECLGVVGESGSGKSVTFLSVLGLLAPPGRIEAGEIRFDGRDLRSLPPAGLRALRGRDIAMTMQDALTALNPAFTVLTQITETIRAHDSGLPRGRAGRDAARQRALEMLRLVGIPEAERRLDDYPHQFSGGMRQRVMIAIALSCRPRLLIADEPTTALDVTIQAQVLDLVAEMRHRLGMSVVLISHDLGVVARHCDRVAVMYAGQVVETGPTAEVIGAPLHPYTQGLLRSIPLLSDPDRPIEPIAGQVPDLIDLPPACRFMPRCPLAAPACARPVSLRGVRPARAARCIRVAA